MSYDKEDNIIDFTSAFKNKNGDQEKESHLNQHISEGEKYFTNLIQFQSKTFNASANQKNGNFFFEKDKELNAKKDSAVPDLKVVGSQDSSSGSGQDIDPKSVPKYYTFGAVAGMMCLTIGVFVFNNFLQGEKKWDRGVASEDSIKTEKAIVNLLATGQRKISSIGMPPRDRDLFSIQWLNSRYSSKWRRGKLKKAKLLEGVEPEAWPSVQNLVKKYPDLFPKHESQVLIEERPYSENESLQVYELRDKENSKIGEIKSVRNSNGAVLSFHIFW